MSKMDKAFVVIFYLVSAVFIVSEVIDAKVLEDYLEIVIYLLICYLYHNLNKKFVK